MQTTIKDLSIEDFRSLIRQTVEETLEDYLEDHAGLDSDAYLRSIEEAREDFRAGRVTRLDELPDG